MRWEPSRKRCRDRSYRSFTLRNAPSNQKLPEFASSRYRKPISLLLLIIQIASPPPTALFIHEFLQRYVLCVSRQSPVQTRQR